MAAARDPWGGETLEWSLPSPPPEYNFVYLPTVGSRSPLWNDGADQPVVVGVRSDRREILVTRTLDAVPDHRALLPEESIWPFLASLAITFTFIGSIYRAWFVPLGAVPVLAAFVGWFWPRREGHRAQDPEPRDRAPRRSELALEGQP
jgi:cytochrome c oxidase subunit 1